MLEWLTPAERRGAAGLLLIVVLGAASDLWRSGSRSPVPPSPRPGIAERADPAPSGEAASAIRTHGGASRLDLNHASAAELERLPGIGPVLAERIVAHRRVHGSFRRIEELLGVRGVGPKLFARLKPRLEIGKAPRSSAAREREPLEGRDVHSAVPPDARRADSASVRALPAR